MVWPSPTKVKEYADAWGIDSSPPLPWTVSEVDALNRLQCSGIIHPFTCNNHTDQAHRAYAVAHGAYSGQLVATPNGWICPVCDYIQSWAHRAMIEIGLTLAE